MKSFPLYTSRANASINPCDSPELIAAKKKQQIINESVVYLADDSDINPPTRIQYGRRGRAIRSFEIDGVAVVKGEEIRYNVN